MTSPSQRNLAESREGDLAPIRGSADDAFDTDQASNPHPLSDIDETVRSLETVDGDDDDETLDVEIMEEDREIIEDERLEALAAGPGYERSDGRAGSSDRRDAKSQPEELAPLFNAENARDYRARWDIVQRGFVDDPAEAVRDGDALVSELISTLSQTYAQERSTLESELSRRSQARTEVLRCALRRHRAFLERLLSF